MEAHQKEMSLLFYKYLCDVIGTQEVVKRRREILQTGDRARNLEIRHIVQLLSSGSKAEGLDLPGSDYDMMHVMNTLFVHETTSQITDELQNFQIVMDTDETKPGYTKLKLVCPRTSVVLPPYFEYFGEHFYLSSAIFKLCQQFEESIFHIHGPCLSLNDKFDLVLCLHCTEWVSIANDFIRRTKYSWASDSVLENVLSFGVLFVPIGSKGSTYTDLEWRISFSFAEKLLIWSFNHVQLLCYALLKILLKETIKKMMSVTVADLLCSYFMKTIMFWLCEEIDVSKWRPDNMLACYSTAFKRLIYCVKNKTCLHYFIPENNFFEDRFSDEEHIILLQTLKELQNIGWTHLLHTETLSSFSQTLTPSISPEVNSVSFIPFLSMSVASGPLNRLKEITSMCSFVYSCIWSSQKFSGLYLLSYCNQCIAQNIIIENPGLDSNKEKYRRFRRQMCHLLIGVNHDTVSGWLLLASLFTTNKQYLKCKYLIDYCLSKRLHEKYLLSLNFKDEVDYKLLNEIQRKLNPHNKTDLRVCKNCICFPIGFNGSKLIFPEMLTSLSSKHRRLCYISPVIFAHYLRFLCDRSILNEFEKLTALIQLANATITSTINLEGNMLCLKSASFL